jgi:hypothetical protein
MPSYLLPCPWGGMGCHALGAHWDGMPFGRHGMGCPWGGLGWHTLGAAWDGNWAAVVIDASHRPIAAAYMPPSACHPNAMDGQSISPMLYPPIPCRPRPANPMPLSPTFLPPKGVRPTRLHRVLPVPFILVPTLISITIAYQYPRPTRLHVLPIPIILVPITQNILLLLIGTLGPLVCIAAKSPSAHPSILYHSLPLILVLNPIHCPSAHPYTVCNQYTINPSPYIIHPPAHPSALGTAHTSAHPSAMATIYPMGPCRMAPSGTRNYPLGWPV